MKEVALSDVTDRSTKGFTLIELLVVIAIIALSLVVLVPVINRAREAGRTAKCMGNMQQIGLGVQNYASTFGKAFPPAGLAYRPPGSRSASTAAIGGYSFLVKILSFMCYDSMYKQLPQTPPA